MLSLLKWKKCVKYYIVKFAHSLYLNEYDSNTTASTNKRRKNKTKQILKEKIIKKN